MMLHHSRRFFTSSTRLCSSPILAIRKEDKSMWERRAPLSPRHVESLVKQGIKVLVQPSTHRVYPMSEYVKVGAEETSNIEKADVILGVKEVPIASLIPKKIYVFFSHTIKGQKHNMPLLDEILSKNICLIDYERLVSNKEQRLVAFGKYAGIAGMINVLSGLGTRLLALGYHTPFIYGAPAHNYPSSSAAKKALKTIGNHIQDGVLPKGICPLIFTFTGSGNVSQGAQEVFQVLPHEYVSPNDLMDVKRTGGNRKLYATVVHRENYLVRKDGKPYNEQHFLEHPTLYRSNFAEKIAPFTTCLVNGVFWKPGNPRLMTKQDANTLLPNFFPLMKSDSQLLAVCDISADIEGSLEFSSECTTIDEPFVLYNPHLERVTRNPFSAEQGILMTTVDNLPAQLPGEATDYFGSCLKPFLLDFLSINLDLPLESQNIDEATLRAIVTYNGSLTANYKYIESLK